VAASGPFAPVPSSGPFAPAANPGPFAPLPDPGPFAPLPTGTTGNGPVADACATACARAVELGCPVDNCEASCIAQAADVPEACHAELAAYILCLAEDVCNGPGDGGIQGGPCADRMSVMTACVLATMGGGPPGPGNYPDAAPYAGP
jgi:hypothetical protein